MEKQKTRHLLILLFCILCAVTEAQTPDSLSKSQMFEMSLAEGHCQIEADLQKHTKTFYDTLGYDSIVQQYYPNGRLYKQCNYLNGLLHDKAVTFHSNGRLKNETHYNYGVCTDSQHISYDMFGFVEFERADENVDYARADAYAEIAQKERDGERITQPARYLYEFRGYENYHHLQRFYQRDGKKAQNSF